MATLKTIRKRISSVQSTQKITRAMKMVAAARLRRAQQAVEGTRPYAGQLKEVIRAIASQGDQVVHPLFCKKEEPKKISLLIFTSNRGLCGGFNSNLLRKVETYISSVSNQYEQIDMQVIGKKGRDYFKSRKRELKDVFIDYANLFPIKEAQVMAQVMIQNFTDGVYDEYIIVNNRFKSALSQEVTFEKLLPLTTDQVAELSKGENEIKNLVEPIYEPDKKQVLDTAIPKYLATQLFQAHLESVASELGARMTAMDSATNNAREMISKLTLVYNRARQAAITKELMDIVNGAEAIK